jgi:two-component system, LytTR family, response regulator LytT
VNKIKAWHHITFWIIVYGSLTLIFSDWFEGTLEAFYYVSLLMPVVMGTSYFFNYYLMPRFLFNRRFFLFGLYSFYMLVVSLCMEMVAAVLAMLIIMYYGAERNGALFTDVFTMAGILYFVVFVMAFIRLIKHYFTDQRAIVKLEEKQAQLDRGYFTVRSNRQIAKINFDELLYLESLGDYIEFHLANGSTISSKEKISHMENALPESFIRIHRSFIVNRSKISSFSREQMIVAEKELPISRSYRQSVATTLKGE